MLGTETWIYRYMYSSLHCGCWHIIFMNFFCGDLHPIECQKIHYLFKEHDTVSAGPDVHRSSLSCDTLSLSSASQPTSPKISSHAGTGQTNSLSGSAQLNAFGSSSNNGHGHGLGGGGGGGGAGGGGSAGGGSSVHSDAGSSPVAAAEHEPTGSRRKRSRLHYYDLNGCLECEVKEAEIKTLRRRIQVMEEVVALLNQKMTALQQSTSGMLFSPMVMPPVVSQVMIPTTYSTSTASMPMKVSIKEVMDAQNVDNLNYAFCTVPTIYQRVFY